MSNNKFVSQDEQDKYKEKIRHINIFKVKTKRRTPEEILSMKQKVQPLIDDFKLLIAVSTNNFSETEKKLRLGVSPNGSDIQSRSLLHIAVTKGYAEIVKLLLDFGADPNKRDSIQNTPLHLAACTHNLTIINYLIDAGADVSSLDMHGQHPLQLAKGKLHILQKSLREGDMHTSQLRSEIKQVINLMISVWNSNKNMTSQRANVNALETLKNNVQVNSEQEIDGQISQLLEELQNVRIT